MFKMEILKHLLTAALMGISILAAIWYFFPNHTAQHKSGLQLLSGQIDYTSNMTEIKGQIKNNTNKEFAYTDVVFNLYDANAHKIGSVADNSGDLKAGETWDFDAIGPLNYSRAFKVVQLMGY